MKPIRGYSIRHILEQKDLLSVYCFRGSLKDACIAFGMTEKELVYIEIRPIQKKKGRGER